jgi:serine/threonine protein kinase
MFKREEFLKLEMLGNGTGKKNTNIYKVEHISTKKIYALKEVEGKSIEKISEYKEEAVQLTKAQHHPNILQFYGYYFYRTKHSTVKLGIICEFIKECTNIDKVYKEREKISKLYYMLINRVILE